MYVSTIYCTVCFLTFTESEYEATNACPYCNNDDDGKLLDVNGDYDDEVEGVKMLTHFDSINAKRDELVKKMADCALNHQNDEFEKYGEQLDQIHNDFIKKYGEYMFPILNRLSKK